MKNLINGGYKGEIYPIHPRLPRSWLQGLQERQDVPGVIDTAVFAIPAKFVEAPGRMREKKIPGAVLIPSGFAEAVRRIAGRDVRSARSTTSA